MTRDDLEDIYELSPTQQGILFDTLLSTEPGTYLVQTPMTLRGALDLDLLKAAWRTAIEGHAVLRTAFFWERLDKPLQVVKRRADATWHYEDWRRLSDAEQQARLAEYLRTDRLAGFDLSRPPLMRFAVFRRHADTHELVVTSHHLILDGWSKSLVLDDALTAYDVLSIGGHPEPPDRRPYRDFIVWLQRQDPAAAERYWRSLLGGITEPTRLPDLCDGRGGRGDDGRFAEEHSRLTSDETAALSAFGRRHSCTRGTLVLGACALLLSRYSGRRTVMFGTTTAGRPTGLAGFDRMVGLFINTLPAVVAIRPGERVAGWLQRLQREQAAAREYDYTPLVHLRRWSAVPADQPLFETVTAFENYPAAPGRVFGGLTVSRAPAVERATFPLSVLVSASRQMPMKAIYDTSRFDRPAIRRLLTHLRSILTALAADPDRTVDSLPMLSDDEKRILVTWNATECEHRDGGFHEWFEAQARRTPDALAVCHASGHLTYADLDLRAARMAGYLRSRGVGPEVPVGLCVERGPKLVVGMLGIWKAGGAVVPLDPSYPEKRLAYMIADSGAEWLVTEARLRHLLARHAGRTIDLDRDEAWLTADAVAGVEADVGPGHLAYVIYTSGSTGHPKGVAVDHRGLCNVAEAQRRFGLQPGDRMLQFASLSFDASIFEISMALTSGATLVLLPPDKAQLGTRLFEMVANGEITAATLPPSVAATLPEAEAGALRVLTVAGEPCPIDLVRRWAPGRRFWNLYGPTEYTIWASAIECTAQATAVTIGRPIANTATYVLDGDLNAVPIGVPGELCLSGTGLARGYVGRPDLTAERFVPDLFSDTPGARMYRTGDRVRLQDSGEIEFRGRCDHQVKIRGFRIELAEIEATLESHPAVGEAVAVVRRERADPRIAAYWKPAEPEADPGDLPTWLAERLPDYMIPDDVVRMTEWPLTPNGKIDRGALPAPGLRRSQPVEPEPTPQTTLERSLSDLWRRVLDLPHVGVQDNFFDLGGNSLLAMRLFGLLRPLYGDKVSIVDLFAFPSIRALAGHLSRQAPESPQGGKDRASYRRALLARRRTQAHV